MTDIKHTLFKFLVPAIFLTGCGSTNVSNNPSGTFTVAAQYGSLNGSWERAAKEATELAIQHCQRLEQEFQFIEEKRRGVAGWSPQVSEITFSCVPNQKKINDKLIDICEAQLANASVEAIKHKVELIKIWDGTPPPFEISSNSEYPNTAEAEAIARWARAREGCVRESESYLSRHSVQNNVATRLFAEKIKGFRDQINSQVSALIVSLYQKKITYGEFAIKRHEMVAAVINAEREYRSAVAIQDNEMRLRAEQLALQKQQNEISAWSAYLQSVNSRPIQIQPPITTNPTIRLQSNCRTSTIGGVTTTTCQ